MTETESAAPPLTIRLFGPIDVRLNGAPLPRLHSRKGLWLLALLTLRHPSTVERDWLAGVLWPDSSEAQALASLRNTLADLRRTLGGQSARLRSPTTQTLSLDLSGTEVDTLRFDAAVARDDTPSLEEAVALYRGPLLEGCVEEWVLPEREAHEQAYLRALERLAAEAMGRRDCAAAEGWLRRVAAVDPTRESAQRALMQTLAAGGNYAAATQLYRELRLHLHQELNAEPDAETRVLYEQIRAEGRHPAQAPTAPPPGVSTASPSAPSLGPLTAGGEGTVTFLFTDIEGSTRLWEEHGETMRGALTRHDAILRAATEAYEGKVFKTVGDGICAVFATAPDALAAALNAQRTLQAQEWGAVEPLRVRMALYTGIAEERGGDYVGPPLNRVARLLAAGSGGQILLSSATQELARDRLPEGVSLRDLGRHRLPDVPHPEQLFQLLHPDLPEAFPPLKTLGAAPNNLPRQLTSFIGREAELAEVKRLLATVSLLTLTGTGGCGKTRLALQAAGELLAEYEDGIWLVELAALADPGLAPQAVVTALGVREEAGRSLTQILADHLRPKSVLLVLDNCEHLMGACAELAEALLRGCPNLRIVATSRERLGIAGELTYRVPSLSVPDQPLLTTAGEKLEVALSQFDGVRLFTERARFAEPRFAVTVQNAPAVAQLCQRLDGIPLAIELAAARVRLLSVEQIGARLDDRFRLLTGGSRTALPRHQTLRAAIDWSYELLSEAERALLRRLSVFAGGWTLEAVEAVCAGADVEEYELFDVLARLLDKSLVIADERRGEARYRFLETVRQYSQDRLVESGETQSVQRRHRDWYLARAEEAEPYLAGSDQAWWLERLEEEHDNLRAALGWSLESGEVEAGLRLAGALWPFWEVRGHLTEGSGWLERSLSVGSGAAPALRAKAYSGAGTMAWRQSDYPRAVALHEAALALYEEAGDKRGIAFSLHNLGAQAWPQGKYEQARAFYQQSLALSQEAGDKQHIAGTLVSLAAMACAQADYTQAGAFLEESLALSRELGHRRWIAGSLNNLGLVAHYQGDNARASVLLEESLALARELGYKSLIASALSNFGLVARSRGDSRSAAFYSESLALAQELGDKRGIVEALEGLAGAFAAQSEVERAVRLFSAAEVLRETMSIPLFAADRADYDRCVAAARAGLGEEAFAAAWAAGRAMTLQQAVACAWEESGPV